MAINHGYIGRAPSDSSVTIARQSNTASGVTTTFTFSAGYDVGYLDVYINGARLINVTDYAATDGSTITLSAPAQDLDVVEFVAYKAFNVTNNVISASGDFSVGADLSITGNLSVGGDSTFTGGIDVDGHTELDDVNVSGIVTATSFVGDGSQLTGVSGFATALSNDSTSLLNRIFKTPKQLDLTAGTFLRVVSDTPSGDIAFMREGVIHVAVGATFQVGAATTLITNVLGVF